MRLMKEGGIGGFEVQPVYPLSPDIEPQDMDKIRPEPSGIFINRDETLPV
jgi:hypothetical protein